MNPSDEQIENVFPTDCHIKVIAEQREGMAADLSGALLGLGIENPLLPGNESAGGKYLTYNVTLYVESLSRMRVIDEALRTVAGVKMVL